MSSSRSRSDVHAFWKCCYPEVWHLWIPSNQQMYLCDASGLWLYSTSILSTISFCTCEMQLIIPGLKTAYCLWALCLPLPLSLSLSFIHFSSSPSSSFSCKLKATSVPISWEGSKQCCRNYPLQNWSKQSQSGTARKSRRMKLGESVTFLNLLYHWERVGLHCLQGMSMAVLTILFFLGLYSLHTVLE